MRKKNLKSDVKNVKTEAYKGKIRKKTNLRKVGRHLRKDRFWNIPRASQVALVVKNPPAKAV